MLRLGQDQCRDLGAALEREWLETNALGGFASSTIAGANTRRYHGLLTAATNPPVGRMVLLAKLEETLLVAGQRFELSVNRYPGAVHPQGHLHMVEFRLDPFPTFVYEAGGARVEKRVFMVDGENTTVVEYTVSGGAGLEIRPLLAFRDYHSTAHANAHFDGGYGELAGLLRFTPYHGGPTLYLAHDAGGVERTGHWYYNFELDVERDRGLDFREDLFNPCALRFGGSASIIASTVPHTAAEAPSLRRAEIARRPADPLLQAASQFLVRRGDRKTVIAGYHWFGDWGRDTMIALPGLTLAAGRPGDARDILAEFARHVDQGMLPNRFPDAGETPEYNTVDATLWFFEATRAYVEATGDRAFFDDELRPVLADIVDWHVRGTRYNIRVDEDGLLSSGAPGAQLTWMDAKIGDWVVTPRHGKPVEIQALWYNALCVMEAYTGEARYGAMAARAQGAFAAQFWNEAAGCLYDVVNGDARDASIRPNQVFAVSLHYPILTDEAKARAVLDVVRRDLLTPAGLRSLAPSDPQYRGTYEGGVWSRDSAYHQGTVWPWLLGAFAEAWRKIHGGAEDFFAPLRQFMEGRGLHQIPEIFDGDAPHHPRGCIAQAWSVAELLRLRGH